MNKKGGYVCVLSRVKCLTLCFVISMLLVSCSSSLKPPIRIAVNVWPGYEYLFLAQEKSYFKDEGVELQLVETASLNDSRRAFERGKVDGMASSAIEVVHAAANSGRIAKIFMVPDFSNGADVILSKKTIASVSDLKAKRVGLEVASLGQFMMARSLQKVGMNLGDILMIPMSQEEMPRGMSEGHVDAIMTYPPVSIELLRTGNYHTLFSSSDIPGEVMDVVSLSNEVFRTHPKAAEKILRAWQRALDFANRYPEQAHSIAATRQRITANEFKESLNGIELLSIEEQKQLFKKNRKIEDVIHLISEVTLSKEQRKNLPQVKEFIYRDTVLSEF